MASAVEGCWYNRLKVVPGSLSRYSKDARVETDILKVSRSQVSNCYLFIIFFGNVVSRWSLAQPGVDVRAHGPLCYPAKSRDVVGFGFGFLLTSNVLDHLEVI